MPTWDDIKPLLRTYVGAGSHIYLMYSSPSRVKIGHTVGHVLRRLNTIRNDLGRSVILMGYVTASPELELALHRLFADTRLDGEWFKHEPILDMLARTMNAIKRPSGLPPIYVSPAWLPTPEDELQAALVTDGNKPNER